MSLDISIILVNHATDELTVTCLRSLEKISAAGAQLHVLVVDNGSPKDFVLPKHFQNHKTLDVSLLRSESNLGFTGGNNMGIHAAIERYNSDYVVLLNNDTIVDPGFLEKLLDLMHHQPKLGVASSKIYFEKGKEYHRDSYSRSQRGKVLWYAGGSIDWQNLDCFHRGVDEVDVGQFALQSTSDFATGCCLIIRREVLEKIGLLDKQYFLYYEDADWSMKTKQFGYEIGYCDASVVWHVNAGSSSGAGSAVHQYYQTRNRLVFFWKYGSWRRRLTVLSLAYRLLRHGSRYERMGVLHFLTGKRGKQPLS